MDFHDAPEIIEFRQGLRDWLTDYAATHDMAFGPTDVEQTLAWNRDLAAAGYVAVSFPVAYGGRGLAPIFDAVINEELAAAAAPPPPPIGHIAHSVSDFGSDELKTRFLPGLLGCTVSWCQGFSEPGAGSDLASLTTSGTFDGETIRVNGQKIWTSGAMWSKWCLLFIRTETDKPRHKGLSMVVVDMDSPGIDRRQIVLSTGGGEFAEVFFDDVEVPIANLVGERGQGWAIAMHMLSFERGPADMGWTGRYARDLAQAQSALRDSANEAARRRLAKTAVGVRVLEWQVKRTLANRTATPDSAGSLDKLLATRVEQDLYRTISDLRGAEAVLGDSETSFDGYLYSRAQSIYGGSQQIQRSIVAHRLLGLPRT